MSASEAFCAGAGGVFLAAAVGLAAGAVIAFDGAFEEEPDEDAAGAGLAAGAGAVAGFDDAVELAAGAGAEAALEEDPALAAGAAIVLAAGAEPDAAVDEDELDFLLLDDVFVEAAGAAAFEDDALLAAGAIELDPAEDAAVESLFLLFFEDVLVDAPVEDPAVDDEPDAALPEDDESDDPAVVDFLDFFFLVVDEEVELAEF
jgi:hypothetical protein